MPGPRLLEGLAALREGPAPGLAEQARLHLFDEIQGKSGQFERRLQLPNSGRHGVTASLFGPLPGLCDVYSLHTTGLAGHPLPVPQTVLDDWGGSAADYARMEVLLLLPPGEWTVSRKIDQLLHYLDALACVFEQADRWLWQHHLLTSFHPLDGGKSSMLVESLVEPLRKEGGLTVSFFYLVPLSAQEAARRREVGGERLLDEIRESGREPLVWYEFEDDYEYSPET